MRGDKGFALVLVLVVTSLMVAVTVELIHQVYVDTSLSRGFRDGQQASLVAESGITAGKQYIPFMFSSKGYTWPLDPVTQVDETGTITITIAEESGKICLNNLVNSDDYTMKSLKRLGASLNLKDDLWNALADWVDSDDIPRSGGAEKTYYVSLKPPYQAHNYKLVTLAELSLVMGFTSENGYTPHVASKLAQDVTVHQSAGPRSLVNINTAPAEVIAALDAKITSKMAEQIVAEVKVGRPFKSVTELARISGFENLATSLIANTTVKGDVFRITSRAKVKDTTRTVEAVWRMSDGRILSWQEY